jgi:hypothetical protein
MAAEGDAIINEIHSTAEMQVTGRVLLGGRVELDQGGSTWYYHVSYSM